MARLESMLGGDSVLADKSTWHDPQSVANILRQPRDQIFDEEIELFRETVERARVTKHFHPLFEKRLKERRRTG